MDYNLLSAFNCNGSFSSFIYKYKYNIFPYLLQLLAQFECQFRKTAPSRVP